MRDGAKRIAAGLAVVGAAALVGACPLPQPLPGVGTVDAGVIAAPPFVETSTAVPTLPATAYGPPSACGGGADFVVSASVVDYNTTEQDEVRWFLDYDPTTQVGINLFYGPELLPAPSNATVIVRVPSPVHFRPSDYDTAVPRSHVLEMAVSNGFQPVTTEPSLDGGMPNVEPAPGYGVQVFRWTFNPQADGGCGP